jgi:hypothetical protein
MTKKRSQKPKDSTEAKSSTGLGEWLPGLPTKPGTYLYAAPPSNDIPRLALVDVVRWRGELVEDLGEREYMMLTSYKPGRWAGPLKWNAEMRDRSGSGTSQAQQLSKPK